MLALNDSEVSMEKTYLTTAELAQKLHYNSRYICNYLLDSVLIEGIHYFRPFGRRKILFIWETIENDMFKTPKIDMPTIPLARGGVCHG
jgi:hypothetical protein